MSDDDDYNSIIFRIFTQIIHETLTYWCLSTVGRRWLWEQWLIEACRLVLKLFSRDCRQHWTDRKQPEYPLPHPQPRRIQFLWFSVVPSCPPRTANSEYVETFNVSCLMCTHFFILMSSTLSMFFHMPIDATCNRWYPSDIYSIYFLVLEKVMWCPVLWSIFLDINDCSSNFQLLLRE